MEAVATNTMVTVKPLDTKKWHNKKGKEDFTQPKTIEALIDPETGRYDTGLTDEEAEKLGKELGVNLMPQVIPGEPHPFYSTKPAEIKLPNHPIVLNSGKLLDRVKIALLKTTGSGKRVANSMQEWENGMWSDATHVIHDEAAETEIKASKLEKKNKARRLLFEMPMAAQIAYVQVLRNKNLKGRSESFVTVEMEDIIENDTDEFLNYVGMGPEEVKIRAQVMELLQKNILTKQGTEIHYMGDMIAPSYDEAIKWFKDPNNQKQKVVILEKLVK